MPKAERPQGERRLNVMPRPEPSAIQNSTNSTGALAAARRDLFQREIAPPTFGQPTLSQRPPQYVPAGPPKKKWPWLIVWAIVVIALAVFGLRYWMGKPVQEPIALSVLERDGQLRIEWNRSARPVTAAVRGTLVINDGSNTKTMTLSPKDLTAGSYTYQRQTGDVEVRMSVEDSEGTKVQEASRFVGQPPVKVDQNELTDLKKKRDELEAEIERLKRQNRDQLERIQQLERTVQIMQTRVK